MTKPVNTLIWYWGRRGGGPRYTLELAKSLAKRDDVNLHLSLSKQSELYDYFQELDLPGFDIDTYQTYGQAYMMPFRFPGIWHKLYRYIKDNDIKVVLCTMTYLFNPIFSSAVKAAGAKYVLVAHDAVPHLGEANLRNRLFVRRDLTNAHRIVTLSTSVLREVKRIRYIPKDYVIPHGVFCCHHNEFQAKTFPKDRPVQLLFFGRLLAYKGLDLLINAYAKLKEDGRNVQLKIVGSGDDQEIRKMSENLDGVEIDQRWVKEEDVPSVVSQSDIVVMPYREASQSGVIPVACATGVPVVATPVGGIPEQIEQTGCGVISAAVTPAAIAGAVSRLLDDPELYDRCAKSGMRAVDEILSWEKIGEQFAEVIKDTAIPLPTAESMPLKEAA